ncbi:MAG: S9 family peptidase [Planctomycetia bacterium]|nr:S9 family peptidase [Planctomycetia bacterium]
MGLVIAALAAGAPLVLRADDKAPPQAKKTAAVKETTAVQKSAVQKTPLIPRDVLFGNPDKAALRISHDGKHVSFLAPVNGVLNVWVAPADKPDEAKPVTKDTKRGIRSYFWPYTNKHILYIQDKDGDENWHVYRVDLGTLETTDLTPLPKIAAQIDTVSHRNPTEIVVGLNDRDETYHDLHLVNLETGERKLLQKNTEFAGFLVDEDYRVRFGLRYEPDGTTTLHQKTGDAEWKQYMKIPQEDTLTTSPSGFDRSGLVMYMIDSRGRDTSAMTTIDLRDGKQAIVARHDKADVSAALMHPTENTLQAVSFEYTRTEWTILDAAVQADFKYLRTVAAGDIQVTSRTLDDKIWTVAFLMDNGPVRYYVYDRAAKKAKFLFTNRKALEEVKLEKMHPVVIPTRDGLSMVSYLTLPKGSDSDADGRPDKPVPLVLNVHGGPWSRDNWGLDPEHQWLADRGYAVLSVNYRGSTGFGKKFLNSAAKEWAGKMHDDLIDAVDWAVKEKIADGQRVAIMGGSYGGYATLVGLTFTPDKFTCGVDIVGPSNLLTLLSTIPPYWKPVLQMFKDRVGDPETDEGRKLLNERSPLSYVDKIQRPLLIAQGANDPRVKQAEADQIVKAMKEKKIPVCYVLYPDEGHGFARPENRMSFYAVTEAFLAQHLGGKFEPVGDDFQGSTITVPTGAEEVPGLKEALKK